MKLYLTKLSNILGIIILFCSLICFPIIIFINYQFDKDVMNQINDIHTLFLKIDENTERQMLFYTNEYSHYILITSPEYADAFSRMLQVYKDHIDNNSENKDIEQQRYDLVYQGYQHRQDIINKIVDDYNKKLEDIIKK